VLVADQTSARLHLFVHGPITVIVQSIACFGVGDGCVASGQAGSDAGAFARAEAVDVLVVAERRCAGVNEALFAGAVPAGADALSDGATGDVSGGLAKVPLSTLLVQFAWGAAEVPVGAI